MSGRKLRFADLFAGCGGMTRGFVDAGCEDVAAVEFWKPAVDTYAANHRGRVIAGDIREVKPALYEQFPTGSFDLVIGGVPCQGFSMAGRRDPLDPRGQLYNDFFDVVEHYRPLAFVFENVKGLLSMKHLDAGADRVAVDAARAVWRYKELKQQAAQRDLSPDEGAEFNRLRAAYLQLKAVVARSLVPLMDIIYRRIEQIRDGGAPAYEYEARVLNAVDFGVPQSRERVFIIGVLRRAGVPVANLFPRPSGAPPVTVEQAIGDLVGRKEDVRLSHVFTRHSEDMRRRIRAVAPGDSLYGNYSESWRKLRPDQPSPVVKENHGGVALHWAEDRCLSCRELGRLSGFKDSFVFRGCKSAILKQIGNAVPPPLAAAVARQIISRLGGSDR